MRVWRAEWVTLLVGSALSSSLLFVRAVGVLRECVQTVVVDPGCDTFKIGFNTGWDVAKGVFHEQLVTMPNAFQRQMESAYHYRTFANMSFGDEASTHARVGV